jgi:aspartyl-tRNA(Asn)/glutamyl-tRNA(Gln) amidotransferase subunit C
MSLTLHEIERLAQLARLQLTPEQALDAQQRLNGFLGLVEQMQAVDTTGVEPLAHPTAVMQPVQLRLRPDVASEPNQRAANQASAPAVEDGLYLVPRVIE